MRKSLSVYQIELLDFITKEKNNGVTFMVAFSKFATLKKSSESKVFSDWYHVDNSIVRRTYNYEQGNVEKSIPARRKANINNTYTKSQIDKALELKKTNTYKEVEDLTGVKQSALMYHIKKRKSASAPTTPSVTNIKKKKTVKASELLDSISAIKNTVDENMSTIHKEIVAQITHVNQSLKSEMNGIINILKLQQQAVLGSPKPDAKYLVDGRNNVKYLGEQSERVFTSSEVDKLLKKIDTLEAQLTSKGEVLEDRREESLRMKANIDTLKDAENSLINKVGKLTKENKMNNLEVLTLIEQKKILEESLLNKDMEYSDINKNYEGTIVNLQEQLEQVKTERDELAERGLFGKLFKGKMGTSFN